MDREAKTAYKEGQVAAHSEIQKAHRELSREERWVQAGRVPPEAIRILIPAPSELGVTRPRATRRGATSRGEEIPIPTTRDLHFIKGWDETLKKELGDTVE